MLNVGENRFDFCFPLEDKLQEELPEASFWANKFQEQFTFLQYQHVIRAGSPPQTKDIVQYPNLFVKANDDGRREYDDAGVDGIRLAQKGASFLKGVLQI